MLDIKQIGKRIDECYDNMVKTDTIYKNGNIDEKTRRERKLYYVGQMEAYTDAAIGNYCSLVHMIEKDFSK